MILRSKLIFVFTVLFLCVALILSGLISKNEKAVSGGAVISDKPVVIIDPGHGGFDGGAVASDGTVEKDINLKISLCLADMLKVSGVDVILTRDGDNSTEDTSGERISSRKKSDLKNRLALMNEYSDCIFVSIHLNKFTTSAATGSQVFYGAKNEKSKLLGDCIQNSIIGFLQPYNKRVNKQATSSTFLLYNATVPAVLVECGFLSNKSELALLKTDEYQKKMAFCCFCGILNYLSGKGEI